MGEVPLDKKGAKQVTSSVTDTKVAMCRIAHNWNINHFDKIWPPGSTGCQTLHSNRFRGGQEINRDSEWFLELTCRDENICIGLFLSKIFSDSVKAATLNTTLLISSPDETILFKRSDDNRVIGYHTHKSYYMPSIPLNELREKMKDNTLRVQIELEIIGDIVNS